MDKLTTEQKAKRYDEVIEKLRSLLDDYDTVSTLIDIKEELENIFPELAETDDERIRRVIRGWIYTRPASFFDNGISKEVMLAWLEKQGEKDVRQKFLEDLLVADDIYQMSMNEAMVEEARTKAINALSELEISKLLGIEKKGEQKPVDSYCQENCKGFQETGKCFADGDCKAKREAESNDKNEPKFHEGDWVVRGQFVTQVREITGDGYVNSHNGFIPFESAKYYHIWTIEDAMDGDVLFHSDSASNGIFIFKEIIDKGFAKEVICYCDYDSEDHFCLGEHHTCCWTDAKILYPATKEQRDILMEAMADAEYTFDFEKKELKKLGQPEVTKTSDQEEIAEIPFGAKDSELQEATYFIPKGFHAEIDDDKVVIKKGEKPAAWSEEDETYLDLINTAIKLYYTDDKGKENPWREELLRWFKSLKDRVQPQSNWKPSEEQVKAFEHFVRSIGESGYASPYENNTKFLYELQFNKIAKHFFELGLKIK